MTTAVGIVIEVRHSGWKSVNGRVAYGNATVPDAGVDKRLGVTELQTQMATQAAQATAKEKRQH